MLVIRGRAYNPRMTGRSTLDPAKPDHNLSDHPALLIGGLGFCFLIVGLVIYPVESRQDSRLKTMHLRWVI
jgi:hypothetical protein